MRISRKKLLMVLVLWFCAWAQPRAAIFGFDERVPYSEAGNRERLGLLYATGSVSCLDGALGSGFIVDVSDYMEGDAPLTIIATTARVLYDARTGKARNTCAFRPASAPGQYLKIDARLAGTPRPGHLDPNDWAFAKLSKPFGSLGFGRMKLDSRFVLSDADRPRVWAAGYAIKWGSVAFAGKCRAESGLSYLSLWRRKDALASMVIHDCDTMKGARGGPLAIWEDGEYRVIAINAGTSREDGDEELYGIPYDPPKNFFNYSRRFDRELEEKLVAFVSRFAHVKSPTAEVRRGNELIREIQKNLNRLGFDAGKEDGLIGAHTIEAIRAFQTTLGITPTGSISEELLLLLKTRTQESKKPN